MAAPGQSSAAPGALPPFPFAPRRLCLPLPTAGHCRTAPELPLPIPIPAAAAFPTREGVGFVSLPSFCSSPPLTSDTFINITVPEFDRTPDTSKPGPFGSELSSFGRTGWFSSCSLIGYSSDVKHLESTATVRSRGFHFPPQPPPFTVTLMQSHSMGICPPTPSFLSSQCEWPFADTASIREIHFVQCLETAGQCLSGCALGARPVFDRTFPGQHLINQQQQSSLLDAGGNPNISRHQHQLCPAGEGASLTAVQQLPEVTAMPWPLHQERVITTAPEEWSPLLQTWRVTLGKAGCHHSIRDCRYGKGSSKFSCRTGQANQQGLAAVQQGQLQPK